MLFHPKTSYLLPWYNFIQFNNSRADDLIVKVTGQGQISPNWVKDLTTVFCMLFPPYFILGTKVQPNNDPSDYDLVCRSRSNFYQNE